jgi:hypothetical protein
MTTRDEEERRKRKLAKRAHLSVAKEGPKESRALPAPQENEARLVTIVVYRDHLARMVRLAKWGHRAQLVLQVLGYLLFSFALMWGLLFTLRAFLR